MSRTILAALLAAIVILPIGAQPEPDDDGYAPEHGVARISLVNGDVSVRRGDSGELTAASLNGPLVANDHLATGQNASAEIQFDWGNMIRLGPDTEVRLGELQDRRYLVQIATGITTFRVLRVSGADVEISTPTVSVRPAEQGSYRIAVLPDGTTEITVRSGRADIFSPNGTESVPAGRTMHARGTPSDPEYMIVAAIPQDQWDNWNADRDRDLERTSSYRYVSPDVVGAEELDRNGRWNNDPQYGNVWVPNVDPGWAPYRVGRWTWVDYYGWTWVSGDPFGWAPYHYGNWYQSSLGWAWYPGAIGARQFWRPALVGFFGWGAGSGFGGGFGFGNVGWVPLAPRERFRPWYGRGFNNTIVRNNVTVVNNYRNARFVNGRNGVTSIDAGDFGRGRWIDSTNFVRASNNDLVRAGSVQGRLPFTASAGARRMSDREVNPQSLPRVNNNTSFARRGSGNAPNGNRALPAQGGFRGNNIGSNLSNNPGAAIMGGRNGRVESNGNRGFRGFEGYAPGNPGQINRGQINRGQINRGQINPGQINPGQVNRGQIDRGQIDRGPAVMGGRRNGASPAPAYPNLPSPEARGFPGRQFQNSPQQPVRISPPIVRERGASPSVSRPEGPRGGFGTPRAQGGERRGGGGGDNGGNRGGGESRGNGGGRNRR